MVRTDDTQAYQRFGERLEALRRSPERPNRTQADVATAIGVHASTYRQWERNEARIPLFMARRLADYFGVSLDELTDEDEAASA